MNTPDSKKIVSFLRDTLPEFMGHEKYDALKAWHHYAAIEIESLRQRINEIAIDWQVTLDKLTTCQKERDDIVLNANRYKFLRERKSDFVIMRYIGNGRCVEDLKGEVLDNAVDKEMNDGLSNINVAAQ